MIYRCSVLLRNFYILNFPSCADDDCFSLLRTELLCLLLLRAIDSMWITLVVTTTEAHRDDIDLTCPGRSW